MSLEVRPGGNVFWLARAVRDETVRSALFQVSLTVARSLGVARAEPCGALGAIEFFVADAARPLTIAEVEVTPESLQWYISEGAPVGPAPRLFRCSLDWRATSPKTLTLDAGAALVGRVGRGAENWPDGDVNTVKDYVHRMREAGVVVKIGAPVVKAAEAVSETASTVASTVAKAASGPAMTILLSLTGTVLGFYVLRALRRT